MAVPELVSLETSAAASLLGPLPSYSRAEVELLNWSRHAFSSHPSWETWFEEGFAPLLEVPRGTRIHLRQVNEVDQNETKEYHFERKEIRIGRDSEADLILAPRLVSKQHARIFENDTGFYLEDLGSVAGTYLNGRKLAPQSPELLSDGDQFAIVPYAFVFEAEQVWSAEDHFDFSETPVEVGSWSEFESGNRAGGARLAIAVHPDAGTAVLEVDRTFLDAIVQRLTRTAPSQGVDSDLGIVEFLLTSVLARASQELKFPFQLSLLESQYRPDPEEVGVILRVFMGLRGVRTMLRAFVPKGTLERLASASPNGEEPARANQITWPALVSAGDAELALSEFRGLEPGDIVLVDAELSVLLPCFTAQMPREHGWTAKQLSDEPYRIEIVEFFERRFAMDDLARPPQGEIESEASNSPARKLDVGSLPIRMHVVLGQTELSLADLNGLAAGSIIELGRSKNDPVYLAANGKLIGDGELVEVEGKLGVRITGWRPS
jgi:type III secretion system YscQ/HrcQ family protein